MNKLSIKDDELVELISMCVLNKREAQEKLYNLYYPTMMHMIRRYVECQYKAEEILNNGFLRAFKKIHQFNHVGSFEGWLRRICKNAVYDYHRNNVKQERIVYVDPSTCKPMYNRSVSPTHNLYYNQLLELVQQLPKATRNVFNLNVIEGYSHIQISKILDIAEGTSKWHLSEARKELKNKIEKLGLNVTM